MTTPTPDLDFVSNAIDVVERHLIPSAEDIAALKALLRLAKQQRDALAAAEQSLVELAPASLGAQLAEARTHIGSLQSGYDREKTYAQRMRADRDDARAAVARLEAQLAQARKLIGDELMAEARRIGRLSSQHSTALTFQSAALFVLGGQSLAAPAPADATPEVERPVRVQPAHVRLGDALDRIYTHGAEYDHDTSTWTLHHRGCGDCQEIRNGHMHIHDLVADGDDEPAAPAAAVADPPDIESWQLFILYKGNDHGESQITEMPDAYVITCACDAEFIVGPDDEGVIDQAKRDEAKWMLVRHVAQIARKKAAAGADQGEAQGGGAA